MVRPSLSVKGSFWAMAALQRESGVCMGLKMDRE